MRHAITTQLSEHSIPLRPVALSKRLSLGLLGILTSTSLVLGYWIVQGVVIGDWSGIHPINRLSSFPYLVGFSTVVGLFILGTLAAIKVPPIKSASGAYRQGFILGCIGLGLPIQPWAWSLTNYMFEFTAVFIGAFSLAEAVRIAKRDFSRYANELAP